MSDFAAIRFQPQRPLLRELSADRLNTILTEIRRNKPKGERGITVRQSGDGTYIGLAASLTAGKGATPATLHPFQIFSRQNPENANQYLVTLQPGTINGIIAGNWEDSFSVSSEDVRYIVLKCTTNGLVVTSSTLAAESASPASPAAEKWALSAGFDVLIGAVRGASVKQVVFNNLAATGVKRLTTEKANIEFQQLPYDNWYSWVVT
jgi:hypothetical protein